MIPIQRSLLLLPVATVLTVYGIETGGRNQMFVLLDMVATVLTVYGIETFRDIPNLRLYDS